MAHFHELKSILFHLPSAFPNALTCCRISPGAGHTRGLSLYVYSACLLKLLLAVTLSQTFLVLVTLTVLTVWVRYFVEFPSTELRVMFPSWRCRDCRDWEGHGAGPVLSMACRAGTARGNKQRPRWPGRLSSCSSGFLL